MANRSGTTVAVSIALAACAFALPALGDDNTIEMQLTPTGVFKPVDGRDLKVPGWHIDQAIASQVIARYAQRLNPAVLDYEHQTLHKERNGQPAPAAGWIRSLAWRDGQGLFATVDLTQRARQSIDAGEYLYVSPVFQYDATTGDVLAIEMAAITNTPAVHGMEPLALRAAATFGISQEEPPMNKSFLAMCALMALAPSETTEDQAIAALNARFVADPLADLRKALDVAEDAKPESLIAACTALKTRAEAVAQPDPAKYVAVATFEVVKNELATLTAKVHQRDVDALVEQGLADGRLLKSQEQWARDLGAANVAALTQYLASTTPIAALNGTQTGGNTPGDAGGGAAQLSADELAVCTATGIDPKDFAAAKAA